jgi:hypothetical protein
MINFMIFRSERYTWYIWYDFHYLLIFVKLFQFIKCYMQALHNLHAENVLPLLAFHYSDTMETEPCLVYQFMQNGSVNDR